MLISYWLSLVVVCAPMASQEPDIAAIVNGHVISLDRVDRYLKKTLGAKKLTGIQKSVARLEAAKHLVNRHLVFAEIADSAEIGEPQVAFELSRLTDRLAEVDQTLEQYLAENKISKDELLYEFRWRLAWAKYLKKKLTDERLELFFKKHQRKFDGTRMQVAHILFADSEASMQQAGVVREKIQSGEVSWVDAAKKCSIASSSAEQGGEIGWITYDGPMVPDFCQAAMKLQNDEISEPVKTNFGIHLIKCLKIEPGKIGPMDVKLELREEATQFLFDTLSAKNRSAAKIDIRLPDPIVDQSTKK